MQNLIKNIKHGATDGNKSGFDLAVKIAEEHEKKTGNKTIVTRIIDYIDQYDGNDRLHYSFDVIEIIDTENTENTDTHDYSITVEKSLSHSNSVLIEYDCDIDFEKYGINPSQFNTHHKNGNGSGIDLEYQVINRIVSGNFSCEFDETYNFDKFETPQEIAAIIINRIKHIIKSWIEYKKEHVTKNTTHFSL